MQLNALMKPSPRGLFYNIACIKQAERRDVASLLPIWWLYKALGNSFVN